MIVLYPIWRLRLHLSILPPLAAGALCFGLFLFSPPRAQATFVTISGTVYTDEGVTTMAGGRTVSISISGAAVSATGSTLTNSNGTYSLAGINVASGAVLAIYLDNNAEQGLVVTKASNGDLSGVDIYQDYLVTRSDGSTLSAVHVITARGNGDTDITALTPTTALFGNVPKSVFIPTGHIFFLSTSTVTFQIGNHLTINGTMRNPGTANSWSSFTVNGHFTLNGTLNLGTAAALLTYNFRGNFINAGSITGVSSSAILTLRGTGSQLLRWGSGFPRPILNAGPGTYTLQAAPTFASTGGNALLLSGGTLDVSENNYTITVSGGSWSVTHGHLVARSGTVRFTSAATQNVNGSGITFYDLAHSGTGALNVSSTGLTVANTFTNSAGTFGANTLKNSFGGLVTVSGGTYSASTAKQTFNGGLTINGGTFTGSTGPVSASGITLTSGTLTAPSGNFTVSGNWTKSSGTFTPGLNTVKLTGTNQTMSGSTTFYNLTATGASARTLTFLADSTQTITNALTLQGAAGNLLSLRSSTSGTQWKIDPQGTRTLSYIDVKDSNNTNATAIDCTSSNCTDSGNNTNWTFSASSSSSATSAASSSAAPDPHTGVGGGGGGGARGSPAAMAKRIALARQTIAARFSKVPELVDGRSGHSSSAIHVPVPFPQVKKSSPSAATVVKTNPRTGIGILQKRGRLAAVLGEQTVIYVDVASDAWYTPFVAYLIEEGVAQGYKDDEGKPTGEFGVVNPVTRAEFLKLALETAGKADFGPFPPPRNGSAVGTWASSYVAQAERFGLSIFTPDIDVNAPATRGEVVQMLLEALDIPIPKDDKQPPFSDVTASHPHATAIATASFYGLIQGDTDSDGNSLGTFRPDAPLNRAEAAKLTALAAEVMQ